MAPNLPERCFAVDNVDEQLIVIYRGQEGYYEAGDKGSDLYLFGEDAKKACDQMNAALNVTPAQREAMVWGSMFGWDIPAADPKHQMAMMAT